MPYDAHQYQEEKAQGIRLASGQTRLTRLTGKHLRVVNFHLAGFKGYQIAAELGVTEAWVSKILNDPLTRSVIQSRFTEVDNEMLAKATQVIDRSMDSQDPAIALRAGEMVWRARGRFEKRPDDRPTAEDVVQKMLAMAAQTGSATLSVTTGPADAVGGNVVEARGGNVERGTRLLEVEPSK